MHRAMIRDVAPPPVLPMPDGLGFVLAYGGCAYLARALTSYPACSGARPRDLMTMDPRYRRDDRAAGGTKPGAGWVHSLVEMPDGRLVDAGGATRDLREVCRGYGVDPALCSLEDGVHVLRLAGSGLDREADAILHGVLDLLGWREAIPSRCQVRFDPGLQGEAMETACRHGLPPTVKGMAEAYRIQLADGRAEPGAVGGLRR